MVSFHGIFPFHLVHVVVLVEVVEAIIEAIEAVAAKAEGCADQVHLLAAY